MMSEQSSITHFFDVFNNRDLDKLGDLLTENAEFYFPKTQPLLGKKQIIRFFNILFRQYPELEFKIQRKIIQGEMAAVHWTNRGASKRGEPYENEGVTLIEMEGDKIRFISDFFKDTSKF
jgi:ketosteroid isomerase-like protein